MRRSIVFQTAEVSVALRESPQALRCDREPTDHRPPAMKLGIVARCHSDFVRTAPKSVLRILDAIHLSTAQLLSAEIRAVITYDMRMVRAAASVGLWWSESP